MSLYHLRDLIESASSVAAQQSDGSWLPARPENYKHIPFWTRLRLAWGFWSGRYDLVRWPTTSDEWHPSPFPEQPEEAPQREFFKDFNRLVESQQKLDVINRALSDYSMLRASFPELPPHKKAGRTRTVNALIWEALRYSRKVEAELSDMVQEFSEGSPPSPSSALLSPKMQLVESALLLLQKDVQALLACDKTSQSSQLPTEFLDQMAGVISRTLELIRYATGVDRGIAVYDTSLLTAVRNLLTLSHPLLRSLRGRNVPQALYLTQTISSLGRLEVSLDNQQNE